MLIGQVLGMFVSSTHFGLCLAINVYVCRNNSYYLSNAESGGRCPFVSAEYVRSRAIYRMTMVRP